MTNSGQPAITGEDAELLTRLCDALDELATRSPSWRETSESVLCLELGVPLRGQPAYLRNSSEVVGDIGRHLLSLVDAGLTEAFLARAVRDRVTALLIEGADVGEINRRRAEFRQSMLDFHADPDRFRAFVESQRPGCPEASWSDERIREEGAKYAGKDFVADLDADRTAEAWAARQTWENLVTDGLRDVDIERWNTLNLMRAAEGE